MQTDLHNLITDVIAATSAAPPDLLAQDSPALTIASDEPIYMIGLIGGKDVGKSSLVNALVGLPISRASASGPGTETVIAYAHRSAMGQLESRLQQIVPGKFEIVGHDNPQLSRQVLLDLPDIDSVYADHIETTQRMLRHMLFPIWLQSIEKYADQQPQRLLARVAEGNDPGNFLFAINKIDLLIAREGQSAVRELCDDYANRIARSLSLAASPKIYALSAANPSKYDLPQLRAALGQERSKQDVSQSLQLAGRQRDRTLLRWLDAQNLPDRAARAQRTYHEADELVRERLAGPILETALPRLLDNPTYRAALIEPAVKRRLGRWPVIGAINTLAGPALAFIRKSISAGGHVPPIDAILQDDASPLSHRISTTFAHLQQTNPSVASAYAHRKLWEETTSLAAAADLRNRLRATAEQQSQAILDRAGGRSGIVAPLMRLLLTIGAILWFPIIQPVVATLLSLASFDWPTLGRKIVDVLSAAHLLQASTFLLIWFAVLWAMLRWAAQSRAERLLRKWREMNLEDDPQLSFAAQVLEWTDDLLAPLRRSQEQFTRLADRAQSAGATTAEREAA